MPYCLLAANILTLFSLNQKAQFVYSYNETEGFMLNITGLNRFFFVCNFHDMRCKYDKVLSIIHQQLNCEPEDGDVFIVMSKDYV